jgi:predicted anti-sigma-YlaC factor YlaD
MKQSATGFCFLAQQPKDPFDAVHFCSSHERALQLVRRWHFARVAVIHIGATAVTGQEHIAIGSFLELHPKAGQRTEQDDTGPVILVGAGSDDTAVINLIKEATRLDVTGIVFILERSIETVIAEIIVQIIHSGHCAVFTATNQDFLDDLSRRCGACGLNGFAAYVWSD